MKGSLPKKNGTSFRYGDENVGIQNFRSNFHCLDLLRMGKLTSRYKSLCFDGAYSGIRNVGACIRNLRKPEDMPLVRSTRVQDAIREAPRFSTQASHFAYDRR